MSDSIVSALNDLNISVDNLNNSVINLRHNVVSGIDVISTNFKSLELSNLNDLTTINRVLESNLRSIDNKLYYIQYNRKPIEPFGDIFSTER